MEYWTAALATLVFALHPIHIECVAWISASSDSMVTMFVALAFGSFLRTRELDSVGSLNDVPGKNNARILAWRAASLFLLSCALLTKEMAVSFTALVAIYIWLYPGRNSKGWLAKSREVMIGIAPYAAVTLGYILLRRFALRGSAVRVDSIHGYRDMFMTLPYVLAFYLRQLILPVGMTGLYYTPYVTAKFVSHWCCQLLYCRPQLD